MSKQLGSYECKFCLNLHTNEDNYLAHTQDNDRGSAEEARVCNTVLVE